MKKTRRILAFVLTFIMIMCNITFYKHNNVYAGTALNAVLLVNGSVNDQFAKTGALITMSPTVTGGSGSYTYKYVVKNETTGTTVTLKDYSSSKTYSGPLTSEGRKKFTVYVKDSTGTVVETNSVTVVVTDGSELAGMLKVNGTSETINAEIGSSVSLVSSATGGSGNYTYKYVIENVATGVAVTLKGYSSSTSYTGTLTSSGTKKFTVYVKDSKGIVVATNSVTVIVAEELSATLKVNGSTGTINSTVGSSVKLVPTATGGSESYTYKYVIQNVATGATVTLKGYSSSTSYTGTLTSSGTKKFIVYVKDSTGTVVATNTVTVVVAEKLTGTLKVNGSTGTINSTVGSSVKLVPTATGGSESYTYKYVIQNVATGATVTLKGYSSSTSYTGTLTSSGTKKFIVYVKDSKGTVVATNTVTVNVSEKSVTGVSLNKTSVTLNKGSSTTLTATVTPSDAKDTSVTWSSSNTSVATVSGGKVTGVGNGTATITVKTADGGYTDTCSVIVNVPVTGVSLNKTSVTINKGSSTTLTATVGPSDASNKNVTWTSSNTAVATVSGGKVTAVGNGNATITVKTADGGYTVSCTVKVTTKATGVTITNKKDLALDCNSLSNHTYQCAVSVSPSNASNKNVNWSSSNTGVATVDSTGKITGVGRGTATITVKTADGGYTDSFTVYVYKSNEDVPPYGTIYYKVSIASTTNRVMDVYNANTYDGAKVQLCSLNNSDAQLWQFHDYRASHGGIAIVPKCNSGAYILDVNRGGDNYTDAFKENNLIDLWTLGQDNAASMWELIRLWDGTYIFRLTSSDWVAGVTSTAEGAQLMLRKFDVFDTNQRWCLEAVEVSGSSSTSDFDSKLSTFKSTISEGRYIDPNNAITINGVNVGWQCFGFANLIAYNIYGSYPTTVSNATSVNSGWTITRATASNSYVDSIKVGDIVRYRSGTSYDHSIFITKIDGNTLYYADCNGDGDNIVHYERTISKSTLASKLVQQLVYNPGYYGWIAHKN